MLITRTPLRISLGGGGTDLPSYYENAGEGFLLAAAINKYIYVAVHDNFAPKYLIKYSKIEDVDYPHEINHPLVREALIYTNTPPGIEVSSLADIPAGTGLGSSGSFTVGLLKALYARQHQQRANTDIAADACHLEIDKLEEPVGKQDQYIAALGGLTSLTFAADGTVTPRSIEMDDIDRKDLEEHLLLFYTGVRRRAGDELSALHDGAKVEQSEIRENLDAVRDIGYRSVQLLEDGNLEGFGRILTEQWQLKLHRSTTPVHQQADGWINEAISAGAYGGKLVGAGGGGFLLIFADNRTPVRRKMREIGLREIDFSFDYLGSTVTT